MLAADLCAAYEGDPSAASMPEILLGYPGMVAIICYRLARALHLPGAPLIARLMTLVAHSRPASISIRARKSGRAFSSTTVPAW
jgi:serine O-acetyltransferase